MGEAAAYRVPRKMREKGEMDDNLLAWIIEVEGLLVDARDMPREVQEQAYRGRGIPRRGEG